MLLKGSVEFAAYDHLERLASSWAPESVLS